MPLLWALVAVPIAIKGIAGRWCFRLKSPALALLALSPLAYLIAVPIILFAAQRVCESFIAIACFTDEGTGREILGVNGTFAVALTIALLAMTSVDAFIIRYGHSGSGTSSNTIASGAGWVLSTLSHLTLWIFWMAVYYDIQIPEYE